MTKISDKILEKIEKENIKQMPVWLFVIKNLIFWFLWVIALITGAISTSAMFFTLTNPEHVEFMKEHSNTASYVLSVFPYFWLIILILMIAFGIFNIRHTDKGYKYSLLAVVLLNIVFSLIIGSVFFKFGIGKVADEGIRQRMHQRMSRLDDNEIWADEHDDGDKESMFSRFNDSIYFGKTVNVIVNDDESVVSNFINDNGKKLTLDTSESQPHELLAFKEDRDVIILGIPSDNDELLVCFIIGQDDFKMSDISKYNNRFFTRERSQKCIDIWPFDTNDNNE